MYYQALLLGIIVFLQELLFDKNNITITPELKKVLDGRDIKDLPFYWGLQKAPDDFEII